MPPNLFWSLTKVEYYHSSTGVYIVAYTDNPVHLFFRWTYQTIQQHQIPTYQRGIYLGSSPRICFTVYKDNEQNETGDTYVHTFHKTPWPVCETRQFYFWALIEGWVAISESAVFSYHNAGLGGWVTLPSKAEDGHIYFNNGDYNTVHANLTGTVVSGNVPIRTGQSREAGKQYIYRSGLYFDTSSLDPEQSILAAQILLRGVGTLPFNDPQCLVVLNGDDLAFGGLVAADYGELLDRFSSMGSLCVEAAGAGWDALGYNTLWLNPYGIFHINKGGTTKFALRGSLDIARIPDTIFVERNYFVYSPFDVGDPLSPKLRLLLPP